MPIRAGESLRMQRPLQGPVALVFIKQFVKGKANHRTVGIAIRASDLREQFVLIIYKTVDQNGSVPS